MRRAKRRRNGDGSYFTNPKTGITSFKISKRELSGKDRRSDPAHLLQTVARGQDLIFTSPN